ncbi:cation transporter [Alienimonas sp. DA493]|uniref:cation transporter n=1 Tax=Alienimonas sp. DA493 TaxID=3373605 RepID=UPI00375503E7
MTHERTPGAEDSSGEACGGGCAAQAARLERRTLWLLLGINGAMFAAEAVAGWLADSASLLADSLDMLADALVYGLALAAVGRSARGGAAAAAVSGGLQLALGAGVLLETGRRFLEGSEPAGGAIASVGAAALIANLLCLALLVRHRGGGVHMRASLICSVNDVAANAGVILAGGLVRLTDSRLPDLLTGAAVAAVVFWGGVRILREAHAAASLVSQSGRHTP